MRRTKPSLWTNVALLLGVILILLFISEIALRFTIDDPAPLTRFHPNYVYTYNPDAKPVVDVHDTREIRAFNALGFWGPMERFAVDKNKTRRILIIGDSFMSQYGLPRYDDLMGPKLEASYQDVNVVTIGVGGWASDNEYKALEVEGAKYRPDIVIISMFMNDLMEQSRDNVFSYANGALTDETPRTEPALRKIVFACQSWSYVCGWSVDTILRNQGVLVNQVLTALHSSDVARDPSLTYHITSIPDELFLSENAPEAINTAYARETLLIAKYRSWSSEHHTPVVFVMIPLREQVNPRKRGEFFAQHTEIDRVHFDFDKPYNRLHVMLNKNNIPVIDLKPIFQAHDNNNSLYFEVDGHWTVAGHALAAEAIHSYLNESGIILN